MGSPADNDPRAPKAGKYWACDPKVFVGRHVKKSFPSMTPDGTATVEHMWVDVHSTTDDGVLAGTLANKPRFECGMEHGAPVRVLLAEIEDVVPPLEMQ